MAGNEHPKFGRVPQGTAQEAHVSEMASQIFSRYGEIEDTEDTESTKTVRRVPKLDPLALRILDNVDHLVDQVMGDNNPAIDTSAEQESYTEESTLEYGQDALEHEGYADTQSSESESGLDMAAAEPLPDDAPVSQQVDDTMRSRRQNAGKRPIPPILMTPLPLRPFQAGVLDSEFRAMLDLPITDDVYIPEYAISSNSSSSSSNYDDPFPYDRVLARVESQSPLHPVDNEFGDISAPVVSNVEEEIVIGRPTVIVRFNATDITSPQGMSSAAVDILDIARCAGDKGEPWLLTNSSLVAYNAMRGSFQDAGRDLYAWVENLVARQVLKVTNNDEEGTFAELLKNVADLFDDDQPRPDEDLDEKAAFRVPRATYQHFGRPVSPKTARLDALVAGEGTSERARQLFETEGPYNAEWGQYQADPSLPVMEDWGYPDTNQDAEIPQESDPADPDEWSLSDGEGPLANGRISPCTFRFFAQGYGLYKKGQDALQAEAHKLHQHGYHHFAQASSSLQDTLGYDITRHGITDYPGQYTTFSEGSAYFSMDYRVQESLAAKMALVEQWVDDVEEEFMRSVKGEENE